MDPIERRYFGKVDKHGIDLLKKMLVMDPKGRISIEKAMAHPFFGKLGSTSEMDMKKSFNEMRASPLISDEHGSNNNHSNGKYKVNNNSNLPMNNFLQQQQQLQQQH